jgi:hypothetical protein
LVTVIFTGRAYAPPPLARAIFPWTLNKRSPIFGPMLLPIPAPSSNEGSHRTDGPPLSTAGEDRRRDRYAQANPGDAEVHPVEAELARRLPRTADRRIRAAQRRVIAALGDQAGLYLELERLMAERARAREAAHFHVGFEHGLRQGRLEALAGRRELQPLAQKLSQLAAEGRALPSLLLAAWSHCTKR